ncbi:hypothetical protein GCM10008938_29690 [Deinococcus roseus]|uniref:Uncharacterized protein n=1 Tax=Deinococcus roseus TaxID=392414 RepID=A0ABQ2D1H3_9DEIO|nr:hypothetical protein GCM10008938_29690 [Deinococcus roseus]
MLALLVAALAIAVVLGVMTRLDGTSKEAFEVFALTALVALLYGLLPALAVTALSDRFADRGPYPRRWIALGIHLLGGALFLLFFGPYFGWFGLLGAGVFWWMDERLRTGAVPTARTLA